MINIIDITQPLPNCKIYPGDITPKITLAKTIEKDGCEVSNIELCTHNGTHIDAPAHFIKNAEKIGDISLQTLVGPCLVASITRQDTKQRIANLIKIAKEQNCPRLLIKGDFHVTIKSAKILSNSELILIGIENQSIGDEKVHKILLNKKIVIIEGLNLKNTQNEKIYNLIALPLPTQTIEAAPVRAILTF